MHWTGTVESVAFEIGSISISWYGLIITFGMILSLVYAILVNKRVGLTVDDALEIFLCAVPLGILCARFGHVFARPDEYFPSPYTWDDFLEIFRIWDGGLTILTGVVGGVLGAFLWTRWRKVDFIKGTDHILYIMLLAQGIGRWGNFFNQEIYGQLVTDPSLQWFPYAVYIASKGGFYQAVFFYESMSNLACFIAIAILVRHINVKGWGTCAYLFSYSTIRFILEFFRNANIVGNTVVILIQTVCALISVSSLAYMIIAPIILKKRGRRIWYGKGGVPAEVIGSIHLVPVEPDKKQEGTVAEHPIDIPEQTLEQNNLPDNDIDNKEDDNA